MNNDFGFSIDHALMYSIDDYSTPDNWHELGFELQYTFSAFLNNIVSNTEREKFLQTLLDTFSRIFSLSGNRLGYHRWVDSPRVRLLYKVFGISPDEEANKQPFKFVIFIYHDKGAFDLRILKKLEDEINRIAIINRTRVELTNLVIIPRSKETISSKIKKIGNNKN